MANITAQARVEQAKKRKLNHRFSDVWQNSDIVFVVQGEEFHCHSAILELKSPVLAAMFSSDFIEGNQKRAELPGKEKDAFLMFLKCIYPIPESYEKRIDRKMLLNTLAYSKEYQADYVRHQVDQILALNVARLRDKTTYLSDLLFADTNELSETRRECMELLKDTNMSYTGTVFKELKVQTKNELAVQELEKFNAKHFIDRNMDMPGRYRVYKISVELSEAQHLRTLSGEILSDYDDDNVNDFD